MDNLNVIFHYVGGKTMSVKGRNFKDAVRIAISVPGLIIKVVFSSGKILYFNFSLFHQFLSDEISFIELITLTECNGIYRNLEELKIDKHCQVDAGSLWLRKKNKVELANSDTYIEINFTQDYFTEL
jgi:hypothetical protein